MGSPSSRAAEVLERLARDQPRRSLFQRGEDRRSVDPGQGAEPPRAGSPARGSLRLLTGAAATVVVAVVVAMLVLDRRPPPIEERLPLASEEPMAVAGTAPAPPAGAGTVVDGGGASGDGDAIAGTVFVHIGGAVASPGVVELPAGSRVVDAVDAAGGLRPDADPDRVNLAAELSDGQRIVIPIVGQEVPLEVLPTGPGGSVSGAAAGGGGAGAGGEGAAPPLVDVNRASAQELETLPGIGPATAAAIISHREKEGPFSSVDALIDVRGIGEAKLDALRDLVTVGGAG